MICYLTTTCAHFSSKIIRRNACDLFTECNNDAMSQFIVDTYTCLSVSVTWTADNVKRVHTCLNLIVTCNAQWTCTRANASWSFHSIRSTLLL